MAAGQIHHPSPPEAAADPTGHLPCLVQLLAGETAGCTDRTGNPVKERLSGKLVEQPLIETVTGGSLHVYVTFI